MTRYNQRGAPANPPQHSTDDPTLPPGGDTDHTEWKHKPTGENTSPVNDVTDPHPSDEEHYDRISHPGGSNPPDESRDIGPNSHVHDGTAKRPPRNAESK